MRSERPEICQASYDRDNGNGGCRREAKQKGPRVTEGTLAKKMVAKPGALCYDRGVKEGVYKRSDLLRKGGLAMQKDNYMKLYLETETQRHGGSCA